MMFILNPHHSDTQHGISQCTECMLGFLTLNLAAVEGLFIFPHLSTCRGWVGGGWKNEKLRDPNKPVQSLWYEPGLSELGYFIVKYGSIIIFLSTCA